MYVGQMLETVNGCSVISCTACGVVCAVGSDSAQKLVSPLIGCDVSPAEDGGLNRWEIIKGRTWIQVRKGQSDMRWRRDVELPKGSDPRLVGIREFPYLCADCYEEGGTKLDSSWVAPKTHVCRCGSYFRRWADGPMVCSACRTTLRSAAKRVARH